MNKWIKLAHQAQVSSAYILLWILWALTNILKVFIKFKQGKERGRNGVKINYRNEIVQEKETSSETSPFTLT